MAKTVHSKVVVSAKDNVTPSLNKLQTRFRIFAKSAQSLGRTFKTISAVSFAGFAGGGKEGEEQRQGAENPEHLRASFLFFLFSFRNDPVPG